MGTTYPGSIDDILKLTELLRLSDVNPALSDLLNTLNTAVVAVETEVGPSGSDVTLAGTNPFTGVNTFTNAAGIVTRAAATQDGVKIVGRAGGSSSYLASIIPGTLSGNITLTTPTNSGTLALLSDITGGIGGTIAAGQVAYGSGANTIQGSAALTFSGGNLSTTGIIFSSDGAQNLPSFSFTSDPTTGLYLGGAGDLGLAAGGVRVADMSSTGFTFAVIGVFPDSSLSAASLRMPHGVAPASPINGDCWTTTVGVFAQINGLAYNLVASPVDTVWPAANAAGVLTNDGFGSLAWIPDQTGGPGGSDTQVQFNDSGAFGGDVGMTYDRASAVLTLGGGIILPAGSAAAPSLQFDGVTDAGIYRVASGVGIAAGGVNQVYINTSNVSFAGQIVVASSGISTAKITGGGSTTGIAFTSTTGVGFVVGGASVFDATAATLTIADGVNIAVNATTGTKIGTATTQKIAFFNATPVVQGASVADATGGAIIDAEARTAINALISRIEATGLIATV